MILYRRLDLNVREDWTEQLRKAIHFYLKRIDHEFQLGIVGLGFLPSGFRPSVTAEPIPGRQVVVNFWSVGANDTETMENLGRLLNNVHEGLQRVSEDLSQRGA